METSAQILAGGSIVPTTTLRGAHIPTLTKGRRAETLDGSLTDRGAVWGIDQPIEIADEIKKAELHEAAAATAAYEPRLPVEHGRLGTVSGGVPRRGAVRLGGDNPSTTRCE
jgi:hypothetical protein